LSRLHYFNISLLRNQRINIIISITAPVSVNYAEFAVSNRVFSLDNVSMHTKSLCSCRTYISASRCGIFFTGIIILLLLLVFWSVFALFCHLIMLSLCSCGQCLINRLIEHCIDIKYIQNLLGHKNIATTERYTHVSKKSFLRIPSPFD
jgi:hypothetical protein